MEQKLKDGTNKIPVWNSLSSTHAVMLTKNRSLQPYNLWSPLQYMFLLWIHFHRFLTMRENNKNNFTHVKGIWV